MYSIKLLPAARKDIKEIKTYIKYNLKNPRAAEKLINKIYKEFQYIQIFPYSNVKSDIKNKSNVYWYAIVKKHCIFYTIDLDSKTIIISRILLFKRNLEKVLL